MSFEFKVEMCLAGYITSAVLPVYVPVVLLRQGGHRIFAGCGQEMSLLSTECGRSRDGPGTPGSITRGLGPPP